MTTSIYTSLQKRTNNFLNKAKELYNNTIQEKTK